MKQNSGKHRCSIRLKNYDYSQAGGYFVTICTQNNECVFGEVINEEMRLNKYGKIVKDEWIKTAKIRRNVLLDEYVIMPNHMHVIIVIIDDGRGTLQRAPTVVQFGKPVSNSIPTIIRLFKSTTTKQVNQIRNTPTFPVWQRNYYEHVIRNEDKLNKIRQYIQNNSLSWHLDRENPERVGIEKLEDEIFKSKKVNKVNK
jgi:putative transposase